MARWGDEGRWQGGRWGEDRESGRWRGGEDRSAESGWRGRDEDRGTWRGSEEGRGREGRWEELRPGERRVYPPGRRELGAGEYREWEATRSDFASGGGAWGERDRGRGVEQDRDERWGGERERSSFGGERDRGLWGSERDRGMWGHDRDRDRDRSWMYGSDRGGGMWGGERDRARFGRGEYDEYGSMGRDDPGRGAGGHGGFMGGMYGGMYGGGMRGSDYGMWGRGREESRGWGRDDDRSWGRDDRGDDRGMFEKLGDKMKEGMRKLGGGGGHRGPKGYKRSDERIREDVAERFARSFIDASDVEVTVSGGEVTLSGHVDRRDDKRRLEDIAEEVFGVEEVHNHLRVHRATETGSSITGTASGAASGQTKQPTESTLTGQAGGPQAGGSVRTGGQYTGNQPGGRH